MELENRKIVIETQNEAKFMVWHRAAVNQVPAVRNK